MLATFKVDKWRSPPTVVWDNWMYYLSRTSQRDNRETVPWLLLIQHLLTMTVDRAVCSLDNDSRRHWLAASMTHCGNDSLRQWLAEAVTRWDDDSLSQWLAAAVTRCGYDSQGQFFMHSCSGRMTTTQSQLIQIYRRLRHTQHWTQNRTSEPLKYISGNSALLLEEIYRVLYFLCFREWWSHLGKPFK